MNTKSYILILLLLLSGCAMRFKKSYIYQKPHSFRNNIFRDSVSVIWSTKLRNYPEKIINLNQNQVIIGDSRGGLMVMELHDGKKIDRYWKDYIRPVRLYDIIDNTLYFSSKNEKEIIAWNLKKGQIKWKRKYKTEFTHLFKLAQKYYVRHERGLFQIDTAQGKLQEKLTTRTNLVENQLLWNNKILLITEKGTILFADPALSIERKYNTGIRLIKNSVLKNNLLAIHNSSGLFKIVNLKNGKTIFNRNFKRTIYSAPIFNDNWIMIPFADGEILAFDYKRDEIKWNFSYPALLNLDCILLKNKLIVPYADGTIFCIHSGNGSKIWEYQAEKSINYVKLTHQGLLYSHDKKLNLIRNKHETPED